RRMPISFASGQSAPRRGGTLCLRLTPQKGRNATYCFCKNSNSPPTARFYAARRNAPRLFRAEELHKRELGTLGARFPAQPIPSTPYGLDQPRVLPELFTQPADVHLDHTDDRTIVGRPTRGEQRLAVDDQSR